MPQAKPVAKKNSYDLEVILNENFNIIIVVFVLIFLVTAYFLVIKPKFNTTLLAIKNNVSQQEQFYNAQKQSLFDLKAAATMYQQLEESDLEKIQLILPNDYAKEKLFGELEDIISQQGVLVSSIALNKLGEDEESSPIDINDGHLANIPSADRIGIIQVELSLGALDYRALKNILPLLESHLQLLDIQSLDFNQEEKSAELSLFTYYFKN
jgi:hypothetical protein